MGLGALEPHFWEAFCKSLNREDLVEHQFAEGDKQAHLISEVSSIFKEKTRKEWIQFFNDVDCCCEPVNSVTEALQDTQLLARDMILQTDHPTEGRLKQLGIPVKFSETPGSMRLAPPSHGQHTRETLKGLGYKDEEIRELEEEGVIE
jgi:crotonobetainyl-CoA:carnitine CoA-transferase CaiB-like acyl-CoA transferase